MQAKLNSISDLLEKLVIVVKILPNCLNIIINYIYNLSNTKLKKLLDESHQDNILILSSINAARQANQAVSNTMIKFNNNLNLLIGFKTTIL